MCRSTKTGSPFEYRWVPRFKTFELNTKAPSEDQIDGRFTRSSVYPSTSGLLDEHYLNNTNYTQSVKHEVLVFTTPKRNKHLVISLLYQLKV